MNNETFRFEYTIDNKPKVYRVTVTVPDNGEPFTDLADKACDIAHDKAAARFPGADVELWEE